MRSTIIAAAVLAAFVTSTGAVAAAWKCGPFDAWGRTNAYQWHENAWGRLPQPIPGVLHVRTSDRSARLSMSAVDGGQRVEIGKAKAVNPQVGRLRAYSMASKGSRDNPHEVWLLVLDEGRSMLTWHMHTDHSDPDASGVIVTRARCRN